MKKKILYIVISIFLVTAFFILYKGLSNENVYKPDKNLDLKLIDFKSNELMSNEEVIFFDLLKENDYSLLNIWSSWCAPCVEEHKFLMKVSKNKNLNMIGLNYKDNKKNAKKFLSNLGDPFFKTIVDENGTKSILFGAYGVPETFLIDNRKKIIIKKYIGPLDKKKIEEIEKYLK